MIRTANGRDVRTMLERVRRHPDRYSTLTICSPYLDERMVHEIGVIALFARRAQCGLRLITSPNAMKMVATTLDAFTVSSLQATTRADLHAKIYVAVGRLGKGRSEAVITSANLTGRGLEENVELGVRATAGSSHGRQLIAEVKDFIARIAA